MAAVTDSTSGADFPADRLVNIHGTDSRIQCMSCGKEEPRRVGQDLFVAVGSSLVVSPVNQLFAEAKAAGARCAILTASETPFDDAADWKLADPVEDALPMLGERVLAS